MRLECPKSPYETKRLEAESALGAYGVAEEEAGVEAKEEAEVNQVLIGQKPVMKYVITCITSFNAGSKRIVLKARGRAISRAVDTAELLRRVFMRDVEVEKIEIGTEEVERTDRLKSNVSTIEISLIRK